MTPASLASAASLAAVCGLLTACASQRAARIAENPEIFATLDPVTRNRIRNGDIDLGYRTELVYLALGKPSRITKPEDIEGLETWVYSNFVFGAASAATVALNNPGARYQSRQVMPNAPRSGLSITSVGPPGPTPTLDDGSAGIATLLVDIVDERVVRIRLER